VSHRPQRQPPSPPPAIGPDHRRGAGAGAVAARRPWRPLLGGAAGALGAGAVVAGAELRRAGEVDGVGRGLLLVAQMAFVVLLAASLALLWSERQARRGPPPSPVDRPIGVADR
jgi:hypothetical protein